MAYKPKVLTVADGGTGLSTLTAHTIQLGNGTSSPTQLSVGATGTVLQGSTGADPVFTATPTLTSLTLGSGAALSTYQTGTWSPNLQVGGSSTGITYATQAGGYTQIGNVVIFWINVSLSSKGANSGNLTISNFPVSTSTNGGNNSSCSSCFFSGFTNSGYSTIGLWFAASSAVASILCSGSGQAAANVTASLITNNFQFILSGSYIVD